MENETVQVKLNVDWQHGEDTYIKGTLLKVDVATAERLAKASIASIYDVDAEAAAEAAIVEAAAERKVLVREAVATALAAQTAENKRNNVTVIEKFDARIDPTGGMAFSEFLRDVQKAGVPAGSISPKLKRWETTSKAASEGVDAAGGFLVPTEHSKLLLTQAMEESVFAQHAFPVPMQTNHIEFAAMFDQTHAGAHPTFFGGVKIYRTGELVPKTETSPGFGEVQLNLHEITALCKVSDSLISDSPVSMEALLTKAFSQAISWTLDDDLLNGDGVGKPLGVLNCNAFIEVAKVAAQAADTVVAENINSMYAAMYGTGQQTGVWICNNQVSAQLLGLTLGNMPMYIPPGGLANAPFGNIYGRPVHITEKLPVLGDANDIIFVDPTQYLLGTKVGKGLSPTISTSIHLYFDYNATAFRFVLRYDGTCWWKSKFTAKNGNFLSPYVGLAVRA